MWIISSNNHIPQKYENHKDVSGHRQYSNGCHGKSYGHVNLVRSWWELGPIRMMYSWPEGQHIRRRSHCGFRVVGAEELVNDVCDVGDIGEVIGSVVRGTAGHTRASHQAFASFMIALNLSITWLAPLISHKATVSPQALCPFRHFSVPFNKWQLSEAGHFIKSIADFSFLRCLSFYSPFQQVVAIMTRLPQVDSWISFSTLISRSSLWHYPALEILLSSWLFNL